MESHFLCSIFISYISGQFPSSFKFKLDKKLHHFTVIPRTYAQVDLYPSALCPVPIASDHSSIEKDSLGRPPYRASIAQRLERLSSNQEVSGSNPDGVQFSLLIFHIIYFWSVFFSVQKFILDKNLHHFTVIPRIYALASWFIYFGFMSGSYRFWPFEHWKGFTGTTTVIGLP